jgi:hypothetical protein
MSGREPIETGPEVIALPVSDVNLATGLASVSSGGTDGNGRLAPSHHNTATQPGKE